MDRRWNAKAGETGVPRENPPASGIVKCPSYCTTAAPMNGLSYNLFANRPTPDVNSPLMLMVHMWKPSWVLDCPIMHVLHIHLTGVGERRFIVVKLLASHQGEPASIPCRITSGFWKVGIVQDDDAGQRVFSGISRYPPPLHSGAAPFSPRLTHFGSQDLVVRGAQISQLNSIPFAIPHYSRHANFALLFGIGLNFTVLSALEPASFLHWLLHRCEATPFLTELHDLGGSSANVGTHLPGNVNICTTVIRQVGGEGGVAADSSALLPATCGPGMGLVPDWLLHAAKGTLLDELQVAWMLTGADWRTAFCRVARKRDSTVLCTREPQMFVHWLLLQRVASVTPHLPVWLPLLVSLRVCYWPESSRACLIKCDPIAETPQSSEYWILSYVFIGCCPTPGNYGIGKVFPWKSAIGPEACRVCLINCDPTAKNAVTRLTQGPFSKSDAASERNTTLHVKGTEMLYKPLPSLARQHVEFPADDALYVCLVEASCDSWIHARTLLSAYHRKYIQTKINRKLLQLVFGVARLADGKTARRLSVLRVEAIHLYMTLVDVAPTALQIFASLRAVAPKAARPSYLSKKLSA
ncbi:hypothetical protein PR048_001462 [Dryococelus australis]|uniref:Uncharacterized protein n=1 Tax=Dryococelus australis TaxID=614101 RepID=A0ABQ9IHF4_9NEOP|nr:hypothetical protein PR048_001462 [Dryococelus australis]